MKQISKFNEHLKQMKRSNNMNNTPPNCDRDQNQVISIEAAARLLPVDGKPIAKSSVWRYVRKGKNGIYLRGWYRGRRLVTTPHDVYEFDKAVSEADAEKWDRRRSGTE